MVIKIPKSARVCACASRHIHACSGSWDQRKWEPEINKNQLFLEKLAPAAEEPVGKGRHRSVQRATGLKQVVLLMVRIVMVVVVVMVSMEMMMMGREDDIGCVCWAPADGCDGLEHVSVRKPWVWILLCLPMRWGAYWLTSLLFFGKCGNNGLYLLQLWRRKETARGFSVQSVVHSKYSVLGDYY